MAQIPSISGYTSGSGVANASTSFSVDPTYRVVSGGVAPGDWIIIIFGSQSTYATSNIPSAPGGWMNIVPFEGVGTGTTTYGVWAHKYQAGETTYGFTQVNNRGNTLNYRQVFIRGASDFTDWIIGSFDFRENTGTSTTNVAASITTVVDNSLALLLSEDRNTSTYTLNDVSCTNFTKLYLDTFTDNTSLIATKSIPLAGSVGSSTITYPYVHTKNGIAGIIGIPPTNMAETISWMV